MKWVYLTRTYGLKGSFNFHFPRLHTRPSKGRPLKGGEPNIDGVARTVLDDWIRGRIPCLVEPPSAAPQASSTSEKDKNGKCKGKEKDAAKDSSEGGTLEGGNDSSPLQKDNRQK